LSFRQRQQKQKSKGINKNRNSKETKAKEVFTLRGEAKEGRGKKRGGGEAK